MGSPISMTLSTSLNKTEPLHPENIYLVRWPSQKQLLFLLCSQFVQTEIVNVKKILDVSIVMLCMKEKFKV